MLRAVGHSAEISSHRSQSRYSVRVAAWRNGNVVWLPRVTARVSFKIGTITFRVIHNTSRFLANVNSRSLYAIARPSVVCL